MTRAPPLLPRDSNCHSDLANPAATLDEGAELGIRSESRLKLAELSVREQSGDLLRKRGSFDQLHSTLIIRHWRIAVKAGIVATAATASRPNGRSPSSTNPNCSVG